jgi:magnesium transporter
MVFELSSVSRELLHFKHALSEHHEVLDSFATASLKFFGEEFAYHAQSIIGAYHRTARMVSSNVEFLAELRETNNSLLSTKQNETMRVLAIISFVTFPLVLVAAIFSMDAIHTPIIGNPYDFWIIIGLMLSIMFCFFLFFKSKHWL